LLAIYNSTQAAKTEQVSPDEFRSLLNEHLAAWPDEASANQARFWLGRLNERERKWADAIAVYQGVASDHPQFAEAVEATMRCYRARLDEQAASGQAVREAAADAARYFEHLVTGGSDKLPERWSQTERLAATNAAELWLTHAFDHFDRAERILTAAFTRLRRGTGSLAFVGRLSLGVRRRWTGAARRGQALARRNGPEHAGAVVVACRGFWADVRGVPHPPRSASWLNWNCAPAARCVHGKRRWARPIARSSIWPTSAPWRRPAAATRRSRLPKASAAISPATARSKRRTRSCCSTAQRNPIGKPPWRNGTQSNPSANPAASVVSVDLLAGAGSTAFGQADQAVRLIKFSQGLHPSLAGRR